MAAGEVQDEIIEAAGAVFGTHAGSRALHAKGSWATGTFTATPEASRLSRAAHLQGDPVTALVRFSNASGDPEAHDADRDGRGMAAKLRWDGGETDILTTTSPAFLARTPEDFLEILRLRRPDPETGAPDLEKLGEYLAAHPEAGPSIAAVQLAEPLASFATARYFSPHAFALVDADGERTWVRWSWVPDAGEHRLPDDEARARGRDHLHQELAARLAEEPVGFELRFQLAGPDDALDDPTAVWPDERESVTAGRLELTESASDPERDGHIDVFDPNRIVDGIELSDDPILRIRHDAYSVSAYARWDD